MEPEICYQLTVIPYPRPNGRNQVAKVVPKEERPAIIRELPKTPVVFKSSS